MSEHAPGWYVLENYDGRTATPMNGTIERNIAAGPFKTEDEAVAEQKRRKLGLRAAGVSGTYFSVVDHEQLARTKLGDDSFPLDKYEEPLGEDEDLGDW